MIAEQSRPLLCHFVYSLISYVYSYIYIDNYVYHTCNIDWWPGLYVLCAFLYIAFLEIQAKLMSII